MSKRFTCLICRNEIAEPGAECPYCRGRSMIAEGASPRILAAVFGIMVVTFVITALYARSFKEERRDRGRLLFEAAESAMAADKFEEAASYYRDALLHSRDDPTYRLGLSRALFAAGRYSETENHLTTVRVGDPTSGIVNLLLARLAANEGRVDEAVSYYRTAVYGRWDDSTEDERIDIRFELADFLEASGRDSLLTAELTELAEALPNDPGVRTRLARQQARAGQYEQASALLQSVIESQPGNREALIGRGDAEFQLHNYLTARTQYNKALMYDSDEETIRKARLCTSILELDPTRVGIGASERLRRSRVVIERALEAAAVCRNPGAEAFVGPSGPWPDGLRGRIEPARAALETRQNEAGDAAVQTNLLLAVDLWDLAASLCAPEGPSDEPLSHVIARARQ